MTSLIDDKSPREKIFNLTVIVSALGYFVDIYDLLLFSIVRMPSLKDLGLLDQELLRGGVFVLNMQMFGLLAGGILWGILGDKKGRVSVLFGSILIYSIANLLNGLVTDLNTYGILRLIAGIGLAGELGAAITLVGETMSKEKRGYGTTVVASVGILGAVFANLVGRWASWRWAFFIGGIMGLALLVMRVSLMESKMFRSTRHQKIKRGDLTMLFRPARRFKKYLSYVLLGVPIWFVIGILITFSPELQKALECRETILAGQAVMYAYLGLAVGDLVSGLASQWLKSRKKVILGFMILTLAGIITYLNLTGLSAFQFYVLCSFMGFSVGYWAVFTAAATEQFGINIRATVASTVPNFVRGSVVPLTLGFQGLTPHLGIVKAALIVGIASWLIAFWAYAQLEETFGKEMNYLEGPL